MDIGAGLQKHLHDAGVSFRRRPHQWGLPLKMRTRLHVGAGGQQRSDELRVPRPGAGHQHGLTAGSTRVRIGPSAQQRISHGRTGVEGSQRQGRHPELVHRIRIGASLDQHGRRVEIVPVRSPVECGRAIRLRRIDVDRLRQQGLHRVPVLPFHRLHESLILRGGQARQEHEGHGDDQRHNGPEAACHNGRDGPEPEPVLVGIGGARLWPCLAGLKACGTAEAD